MPEILMTVYVCRNCYGDEHKKCVVDGITARQVRQEDLGARTECFCLRRGHTLVWGSGNAL